MKITLDIPDGTICAFFDFIRATNTGLVMQGHSIQSDDLYDEAEIKIEEADGTVLMQKGEQNETY